MKIAIFGFLLAGIYHTTFTWLITKDWARADFSYCYLMPFVVAYLIWEKRKRLAALPSVCSWNGMVPFVFGLILFWLGELSGEYFTLYISFWLVIAGLLWIHLGWQKIKIIAFALFMILTMFPLPNFLYNKISVKLQLISSKFGATFIQIYGMSAHREGNVIDLGFTQLQVVDACSGLRSLMSLIVLGLLMAYLFLGPFWKRAFLVSSTVPLSIFCNSMRLAVTAILYQAWGREVAEGFFHDFSGWIIFIIACAILMLEIWMLKNFGRPSRLRTAALEAACKKIDPGTQWPPTSRQPQSNPFPPLYRNHKPQMKEDIKALFQPQLIAAIALLVPTLVLSQGIEFREKVPISKSLDQFPPQMGEWIGTRQTITQRFLHALDLSEYVIIDYHNPKDKVINLYVAYYESQRKGESIHSPATCLPGAGWLIRKSGTITLSTPGHNRDSMKVNRAYMEKLNSRQLCYYWFPQRGRILNNAYQLKMYSFWDALTMQRTDGALVRLITPISEYEELKQADARLQKFTQLLVPVLAEYIPGKDIK